MKFPAKKYCFVVAAITINTSAFGVLLPFLISSASTEAVLAGLAVMVLAIPVNFYILKNILKTESVK